MVNVVIVSPSPSRRDALRRALESPDVRVALDDDGWGSRPSVTVIDGEDELSARPEDEEDWPTALVLLVDRAGGRAFADLRRRDLGGWTVLPADATPEQLRAGVLAAAAGLASVPLEWQAAVRVAGDDSPPDVDAASGPGDEAGDEEAGGEEQFSETLTSRELEVLACMARGLSNREIGVRLTISEHTAKFHVASVLAKLGAHNRAEAVRLGIRRGLVAV